MEDPLFVGVNPERWFWFAPTFHDGQSALLHKQADNIYRIDLQLGDEVDKENELASKIVRKDFDGQIENYITDLVALRPPDPPKTAQQISCVWRSGNAVVLNLDVVTGIFVLFLLYCHLLS